MITYVLIISRNFPLSHPKAGEKTFLMEAMFNGIANKTALAAVSPYRKIHTIRKNAELWEKRIKKVQEGKAVISFRYWSGKPYRSKQVTFWKLTKEDNVGIQRIYLEHDPDFGFSQSTWKELRHSNLDRALLANNDGLSVEDFSAWFFPKGDKSKRFSGVIIHFTGFRYQ